MTSSFDHVYRVTELTKAEVPLAEIDSLGRDLPVPLPIGYQEYLLELGRGELCDLLRVDPPRDVRASLQPANDWLRETWTQGIEGGWWKPGLLTADDLLHAVQFATSAEGDSFVSVPRFPGELFELPRHHSVIRLLPQGFFGAVQDSIVRMKHDFAFFEPHSRGLGHQCYEFSPVTTFEQFIDTARRRWSGECRQSRTELDEQPSLFFRQVQCRLEFYGGEQYNAMCSLPSGTFSVVAHHDRATADEIREFFQSLEAVEKYQN